MIQLGGDGRHGRLAYSTNLHPGESRPEVSASLSRNQVAIRAALATGQPFGIGPRLSSEAAAVLAKPAARTEFQCLPAVGEAIAREPSRGLGRLAP